MTPAVLAAVLALLAPRAESQQPNWQEVVRSVSPAVVVVETDTGQGSGFLVKSDGTIVTNHHVVAGATKIAVRMASGEWFRGAFVMASDQARDLAILRVEGFDLPAAALGNSNDLSVGMSVLSLGAPRGLEQSAAEGIVSGLRTDEDGNRLVQTSAAVSPGSSGGPLLNSSGQVVGVISFTLTQSQNLNFAVPVNYARGMLDRIAAVAAQPLSHLDPLPPSSANGPRSSDALTPTRTSSRSREEAIRLSKTVYVLSRDLRVSAGVTNELLRWDQYTAVALPEQADLLLEVQVSWENRSGHGRASARLTDRQSALVLWGGTRGGAFTDFETAGKQIVQDIEKLFAATKLPERGK